MSILSVMNVNKLHCLTRCLYGLQGTTFWEP